MAGVRSVLRTIPDLVRFFGGYGVFLLRGTTPAYSYAAMRRLHCQSNGYLNDGAAFLAGIAHPPKKESRPKGVLVASDDGEIHQAAESLQRDGYHVFPSLLPKDDVERLRSLATEIACTPTVAGKGPAHRGPYHAIRDSSSRFDFSISDICRPPQVQSLLADDSIRALAVDYLGCTPILDLVAMWWSRPNPQAIDLSSEAAQLFHFDMDRLKFLKFFFYLTDVDTENGPHCVIRGSHRRKPRSVLVDGRHSDASLHAVYPESAFVEVCGPAGTILAVDTRAFHKGKPLIRGERLLLQIQFSISLFGQSFETVPLTQTIDRLRSVMHDHPRTYRIFEPVNAES
jgi:hypothetical protein